MAQSPIPDAPPTPEVDPDIAPPGSTPSQPIQDRVRVGELVYEEVPDADVTELTPEERLDFSSLMAIGSRTKTISVFEHSVTIRTLLSGDEKRIGLHTREYLDTQGFARAYQVAVCACAIKTVDSVPLYHSLTGKPDAQTLFDETVKILDEYTPLVITQIYKAVRDLEREYADLLVKLGKLEG